jgi:hypothetical protein
MAAPEYLICLNCETPCYNFEWGEKGCTEALCEACGNDEPDQFVTEEDFDAIVDEPGGPGARS